MRLAIAEATSDFRQLGTSDDVIEIVGDELYFGDIQDASMRHPAPRRVRRGTLDEGIRRTGRGRLSLAEHPLKLWIALVQVQCRLITGLPMLPSIGPIEARAWALSRLIDLTW